MVEWSTKNFCHIGKSTTSLNRKIPENMKVSLFLTDPPYNIGHKYGNITDKRSKKEYRNLIKNTLISAYSAAKESAHFFMIHYPEDIAELWPILTQETGWKFKQWITWTYPSNIGMSNKSWTRASRTIIWLIKDEGGHPTFFPKRIVRPYRNPWDKRVANLIKDGKRGCSLYDWWNINLTKNVSTDKQDYANQIPEILLTRIIRSTTEVGDLVADPFSGTYSTVKAALKVGRLGWGTDANKNTKKYWPEKDILNSDFIEDDYNFDQLQNFDIVRAGISKKQLSKIIEIGIKDMKFSDKKKKLISKEVQLFTGLSDFPLVGGRISKLSDYNSEE